MSRSESVELQGPHGFWNQHRAGTWRPHTLAALQRLLTPESTLLDVGAWIGPLCIWAAPLCARVLALEPDPVAYELLVANTAHLANTSHLANVETTQTALAPDNGEMNLYHRGHFGDSMSSLVPTGEDHVTVKTISPVDLFTQCDIGAPLVCNVNIEGSEALVLPALVPLLVQSRSPLLLSVHERWMPPGGPEAVSEALSAFSSVTQLCEDGPGFYELECVV